MNGYWRAANYSRSGKYTARAFVDAAFPHLCRRSSAPGAVRAEATRVLGKFLRDVMSLNRDKQDFRVFGPDETASNRLDAIYEASGKEWMARIEDVDTDLSATGRLAGRQMV